MSGFESAAITRVRTIRENWSLRLKNPSSANRGSQRAHLSSERMHPKLLRNTDPPHFPFLIQGDSFAGFRIERKLGQGGFGAVYLAENQSYGWVALKISSEKMSNEAWAHAIAAGIEYKGLVEALDSGTHKLEPNEEYHWMAIKYIAGPTLEKLLRHNLTPGKRNSRALPPERAIKIGRKIALAAGEMHRAGMVHSDIKTANVMMKSRAAIVLLDYGLTKKWPVPTAIGGTLHGTLSYMAPEQLLGENYGPAADVFAIGVTLWEMLTGNPAREHRKLQTGNLGERYEPLPPLPAHLPPRYQEIINKATALYPKDRYPDGHALARALAEVQIA